MLAFPLELAARWRDALRAGRSGAVGDDSTLASVLSWIRTIALEDDVVALDMFDGPHVPVTGRLTRPRAYLRFPAPSLPSSRPEAVTDPDAPSRVRFVVRAGARRPRGPGGGSAALASGDPSMGPADPDESLSLSGGPRWRSILRLRDLVVFERDAPHGRERPLRLGLGPEEGLCALLHARASAERLLAGDKSAASPGPAGEHPRLAQRSQVAVALWTRGRLRGSVITSPGPGLRAVGRAAVSACQDARFPRLSASELGETVFQVGFLHAPRVPLSRQEIETNDAYPDKALFVSEGTRSGAYMPEVFNVFPRRTARLQSLTQSLARDKAGLPGLGPAARVEVCEVTEVVESADRSRALRLDGPVACWDDPMALPRIRAQARMAGQAACAWLAAIQDAEGALPLFVRPSTGKGEGVDFVRSAMTAEALAAFGVAHGIESAVASARRVLGWLDRSRPEWMAKPGVALASTLYRGKAALCLGDDAAVEGAARSTLALLDGAHPGFLVLAHAASFLDGASPRHPPAAARCQSLRGELAEGFARALAGDEPVSLAAWAELGAAFPAGSTTAREVCDWLRGQQLASGAFPDTTKSEFAYSRGTGKVFEVLALRPGESARALDRSLGWLLSMQYRPDSAFFVPHEHWPRVLGGFRHDPHGTDAWIDAAGHFLLGLARLGSGS
jgi:AMMECR1 domain-containing protein